MRVVKKMIVILFDIVLIFLIAWFALGYINFGKITKGKEPVFVICEKEYDNNSGHVHVYDNKIYKIVKYEKEETSYSLKLWFMKDV